MLKPSKNVFVDDSKRNLYKWAGIFHRLQKNFFEGEIKLRREKQIEDFVFLNEFNTVKLIIDTDILHKLKPISVDDNPDITIITDQKFSRYPCPEIIKKIDDILDKCPNLYLCLNRHYINIDNSYVDETLDDNFNLAITQWLKKSLPNATIVDMSLDYLDVGDYFTWAIPDRHYFITRK